MKKEKSLNFLNSKWLMIPLFVFGILLFGNVNASAQNSPFAERIIAMEEIRDSFAPGTAKYDIVQDAIDYLEILQNLASANPNWLDDYRDSVPQNPFTVDKLRKAHPSILANYTVVQLADFAQISADASTNPQLAKKTQWILDANAY